MIKNIVTNIDEEKYIQPIIEGICRSFDLLVDDAFDNFTKLLPTSNLQDILVTRDFLIWWKSFPYPVDLPVQFKDCIERLINRREVSLSQISHHLKNNFSNEEIDVIEPGTVKAGVNSLIVGMVERVTRFLGNVQDLINDDVVKYDLDQIINMLDELLPVEENV